MHLEDFQINGHGPKEVQGSMYMIVVRESTLALRSRGIAVAACLERACVLVTNHKLFATSSHVRQVVLSM